MIAHISRDGVLVVTPETATEAYALANWKEDATITIQYPDRGAAQMKGEKHYHRGRIIPLTDWPLCLGGGL